MAVKTDACGIADRRLRHCQEAGTDALVRHRLAGSIRYTYVYPHIRGGEYYVRVANAWPVAILGERAMAVDIDLMRQHAGQAGRLLGAMANEKRLMILCQLVGEERSVNELAEALDLRQSTVSQHLALLRKDGLVECRREAQSQLYSLTGREARAVLETLYQLYCAS